MAGRREQVARKPKIPAKIGSARKTTGVRKKKSKKITIVHYFKTAGTKGG